MKWRANIPLLGGTVNRQKIYGSMPTSVPGYKGSLGKSRGASAAPISHDWGKSSPIEGYHHIAIETGSQPEVQIWAWTDSPVEWPRRVLWLLRYGMQSRINIHDTDKNYRVFLCTVSHFFFT